MFVPEIFLFNTCQSILKLFKEDYQQTLDKKQTLLWILFEDCKVDKTDYFEEAVRLISLPLTSQRSPQVRLFFDLSRATLPTIHINLPGEQKGPTDSIGNRGIGNYEDSIEGFSRAGLNISQQTTYSLIITSDAPMEVLILYYILKAGLLSVQDHLSNVGFNNIVLGGQDIIPNMEMQGVFMRTISISGFYEMNIPQFNKEKIITGLKFTGLVI